MTLDPNHVNWCKQLFNNLADGGVWGVPRSGLIFRRRGDRLVLTGTMPHTEELPVDADQLRRQQDGDFNVIQQHFAAAGITVERELPPERTCDYERDESGDPDNRMSTKEI